MSIYEKIKELCEGNGITITALEMELGFGRGSLGKLKHSDNIHFDRLRKVASYFGVPLSAFIDAIDLDYEVEMPVPEVKNRYYLDEKSAEFAQELFTNPDMRVLFDAARDSRPEDLQRAADLLRRFKETNPNG